MSSPGTSPRGSSGRPRPCLIAGRGGPILSETERRPSAASRPSAIVRTLTRVPFLKRHSVARRRRSREPRPEMVLSAVLGPGPPVEVEPAGSACVVIDVLRFTTTLTAALEAGAKVIYPVCEPEDGWRLQQQLGGDLVLGGERGGLRINGFDLGNSPREYSSALVAGRILALTPSNGPQGRHP